MVFTNDGLITALRLEDATAAAVMPLASPIDSGLGLLNPFATRTIKHRLLAPVIVDAGVERPLTRVSRWSRAWTESS